jgi:hypothetical protein
MPTMQVSIALFHCHDVNQQVKQMPRSSVKGMENI